MNDLDKNLLGFILFALVVSLILLVTIITTNDSKDYVLWCVDDKGIELPIEFRGLSKEDINPIVECRRRMFNPVDYYVTEVIK